ncbi:glycoside hydrolase family 3 C-terminal domain-containing protein [Embleya sp. NPDC005575]|uniref:glycoside hydrolase family 3 C-terminal domain-containing protein n=1 Tax=Embleya sp. NPDC005575 TaxID=3156892 RepID=UPI0033BDC24A
MDVAAVSRAWLAGQEGGDAIADMLMGVAGPGYRLLSTWRAAEADVPIRSTAAAGTTATARITVPPRFLAAGTLTCMRDDRARCVPDHHRP